MDALGARALGSRSRAAALAACAATRRSTSRPARRSRPTRSSRGARQAAVPRWFGRLPHALRSCAWAAHEEEYSTIAYYRQPAPDGSRPGHVLRQHVRTRRRARATRPRRSPSTSRCPGTTSRSRIAQELPDLPEFRRHLGPTASSRAGALYTERLSDEMGLYSGDLDRIGMLSFDAWRACRLVVDTGMHALGWSRPRAIDFMVEHTALAREQHRQRGGPLHRDGPGQALAYKTGQLEILRLRAEAGRGWGRPSTSAPSTTRCSATARSRCPPCGKSPEAWTTEAAAAP